MRIQWGELLELQGFGWFSLSAGKQGLVLFLLFDSKKKPAHEVCRLGFILLYLWC